MKKKKSPKYVSSGTYQYAGTNAFPKPDEESQQKLNNIPDVSAYFKFIADPRNKKILEDYKRNGYSYSSDNNGDNIKFERPTGNFDFSPGFKAANTGIDLITGLANKIGDLKGNREEYKQYLESIQPPITTNADQEGRNDNPIFFKNGGIHIKKSHRGLFTKEAKAAGMSVQEYATHILSDKDEYSPALEKRAQFAHNFNGKAYGGGNEVSPEKAKIILHDKEIRGHPLTDKQRRYFGYLSNKQMGGYNEGEDYDLSEEEINKLIKQGYKIQRY